MRGERDSFRQKPDTGGFTVSFSGPSTSSGPFRLFICSSVGDLEPFDYARGPEALEGSLDFTRDPEVLEGRKRHREAVARYLILMLPFDTSLTEFGTAQGHSTLRMNI